MDLNGFKIEKWNVHNIPENVKMSTCPLCSSQRKKKTDKCLQVDWTTGISFCHHCNEVIQLHTYTKKEVKRDYKRPEWTNQTELSDNLVKWFESRSISQNVLKVARITEGKEWMPQSKREENTIQFNYFRNNELINIKYRDGRKNFKMFKDAEKIFYNYDLAATSKEIIIVEGEMDALAYMEAEIYNVVSIPNGSTIGNVNLEYLDNSIEIFENKDRYYLALDNDEAGQNVQKELVRRLGAEKCFIVDLQGYKDANELLQKKGKLNLKLSIENAKEIPITGISSVNDWREEFEEYLVNGMKQGFKTGIESFDSKFSTYTGQYIVVTGKPSCFTKNQKIKTTNGSKEISKLKIGDYVISHNEKLKINEYNKVINTMVNNNTKDKIYRLTMKDGTIIECTENHRFFNGTSYVKIKDLLLPLNKFKL